MFPALNFLGPLNSSSNNLPCWSLKCIYIYIEFYLSAELSHGNMPAGSMPAPASAANQSDFPAFHPSVCSQPRYNGSQQGDQQPKERSLPEIINCFDIWGANGDVGTWKFPNVNLRMLTAVHFFKQVSCRCHQSFGKQKDLPWVFSWLCGQHQTSEHFGHVNWGFGTIKACARPCSSQAVLEAGDGKLSNKCQLTSYFTAKRIPST